MLPMKLTILGVKPSKFIIDDYKEDTVKVYVQMPLDPATGGYGSSVEIFDYKVSEDIHEFKNANFPFTAECQLEMVSTGKKTKVRLRKIDNKTAPKH